LRDLTRADQCGDTLVGQLVAMSAHAVFQASGFETPLAAKSTIIVCTVSYLASIGLCGARSKSHQSKGDKQSNAIARHQNILPILSPVSPERVLWLMLRFQLRFLTPATHAASAMPPAAMMAAMAVAMARIHVNGNSGLLDKRLSLHNTSLGK
jgi:hypothetical protein